jgi:putative oxidoreductase
MGGFTATLAQRGVPMTDVLGIVGPVVEFFGGIAILLGFFTRTAAVLMTLFVIVATLISHRYWEFADAARRMQQTNFDKNLCIMGGFVLMIAAGGGRFSIDGLWRRS